MVRRNFWNALLLLDLLGIILLGYWIADAAYWNGKAAGFNEGYAVSQKAGFESLKYADQYYTKGK